MICLTNINDSGQKMSPYQWNFRRFWIQKMIKILKITIFMFFGRPNHFLALFVTHQMIRAAHRRNTETIRSFLHGALVCTKLVMAAARKS